MTMSFPPGFLWGSATAAAQIEGAAFEDGKRASIWDAFARIPGAVLNGDTLDVAVDHYHRMPEDVALMKQLGLQSYRFSTSWARIRPDDGHVNQKGLDFYSRLVDELLGAGILPWLTLYHWDLPQALEEKGGWANRDTAYRFRDYAQVVHGALGDRVQNWTTFNEPFCSSLLGYASGVHAPGRTEPDAAIAAIHHQHLAHGLAVTRLRELGVQNVGITLNLTNAIPRNPSDPVDVEAARRIDALNNRIFLDPLLRGEYPADIRRDLAAYGLDEVSDTGLVRPGDLETIAQPLDFLGVNHYHDDQVSGHPLEAGAADPHGVVGGRPTRSPFVDAEYVTFPLREGLPLTGMGWEVNPAGLHTLLVRLGREYSGLPPLYVTENGAAYDDTVSFDGTDGAEAVHDDLRTRYIREHVEAVCAAIADGADVRGYFVWSLLDNFEWAWGYGKRFGIVRVDYDTLVRTPKDSALAYAAIIAANSGEGAGSAGGGASAGDAPDSPANQA
ncbi:MAG: glycosyl hydrolase family protein [Herbiconiux sp.]|uniref:glycoside hydrolase family 1 protein n=1 Tax=Herbiconiux sp. TaxID=1871186 RepID=UPI001217CE19|nr:family 1 glycosylhydrolase [Herbiconiux sp.]TAJ48229.1 MAG: glycosyl hydrolase family protein [Herbiconiux sp.]